MIYIVIFFVAAFIVTGALILDKEDGSIYWDDE